MDDLVTWLRAQLDEDEQGAHKVADARPWPTVPWRYEPGSESRHGGEVRDAAGYTVVHQEDGRPDGDAAEHIARWDPERALAEIDAKRQVVELYEIAAASGEVHADAWQFMKRTVRVLALPYADRPGYLEEWKP